MPILSDDRDIRAMTVPQADELFRRIAMNTIRIKEINAGYERRIAVLKTAAEQEIDPLEKELERLSGELNQYIRCHPERFIKPRQHVTDYGKYGLRTVSKLEIMDEEVVKASIRKENIPALIVIERLDKKALEKALSEGKEIKGCEFHTGEMAGYTITRTLTDVEG
ncbi:MAG: host-nuclease inhibitor Gam family protein [Lentisphaeria bacterium]|nr:host-nuclease inhibitor Gam family protein [Lentisphaeria bacterium]